MHRNKNIFKIYVLSGVQAGGFQNGFQTCFVFIPTWGDDDPSFV